jgi:hypothetical protein
MSIIDRTDSEPFQIIHESQSQPKSNIFYFTLFMVCSFELFAACIFTRISMSPILLTGIVRLSESIIILFYIYKQNSCEIIGCKPNQILPGLYYGCVWSLCFGMVVFTTFFICGYLFGINFFRMVQMPIRGTVFDQSIYIIVGCIIGPFAEELVFRGVIYVFFRQWGVIFACFCSTIIFVLLHHHAPVVPLTQIIGGLIFAFSYEYSKMLATPLTIHVLGNTCMALLSYLPINFKI